MLELFMIWRNLISAITIAALAPTVAAASVDDALEQVAFLLESGQPLEALEMCREARVEFPQSDDVLFALGNAEAAAGGFHLRQHTPDEAETLFRTARETFDRTAAGDTIDLRESAAYNAASCLLLLDPALDAPDQYDARVENLQEAVAALEEVLARYPENERARKNLDYARYTLNVLRQNLPGDESAPDEGQDSADTKPASEVEIAETALPNATAEVVDGSTVILRRRPEGNGAPWV